MAFTEVFCILVLDWIILSWMLRLVCRFCKFKLLRFLVALVMARDVAAAVCLK